MKGATAPPPSARRRASRALGEILLTGTLVTAVAALPTGATADDPTQGGLWYYTVPGIDQIHASGITGEGITIAVIDGPINPDVPDLAGVTNLVVREDSFCDADGDGNPEPGTGTGEDAEHATRMVSLIAGTGTGANGQPGTRGVAPGADVYHYDKDAGGNACGLDGRDSIGLAIDQAVSDGADILSLSFSRSGLEPDALSALARAERAGVVVVAASNNRGGTELGWPASANGVVAVESADVDQRLNPEAVTNPLLTVVAPGEKIHVVSADAAWADYSLSSGSSSATAWTAGVLALAWSAHPEATGNQMIQALVRTTAQAPGGEPVRIDDSWGYGTVSARNLMAIDPTTLPDTNPLLRDTPDAEPAYADIVGTGPTDPPATDEPTTEPDTDATAPPVADDAETPDDGIDPLLLVAGIALVVLAGIGAIVAVVLARRRPASSSSYPTTTPPPGA